MKNRNLITSFAFILIYAVSCNIDSEVGKVDNLKIDKKIYEQIGDRSQ